MESCPNLDQFCLATWPITGNPLKVKAFQMRLTQRSWTRDVNPLTVDTVNAGRPSVADVRTGFGAHSLNRSLTFYFQDHISAGYHFSVIKSKRPANAMLRWRLLHIQYTRHSHIASSCLNTKQSSTELKKFNLNPSILGLVLLMPES